MLDFLRNTDDPGIRHPERLALSIDAPLPRHVRRVRDRIGDLAGVIVIVGLVLAALVVFG